MSVDHWRNLILNLMMIQCFVFLSSAQKIEIIRKYNGLVNNGERGVIAIKTSGDPIDTCIWSSPRGSMTIEIGRGSPTTGTVELSERSSLCKLTLNSVDSRDHDGDWEVEVRGKCEFYSKSSTYSTSSGPFKTTKTPSENDDGVHFESAPLKLENPLTGNLKVGLDGCANAGEMKVNLKVVDGRGNSDLEVSPAQRNVYGTPGSPISLTMRANKEFLGCKAKFKRGNILEMRNQQRSCVTYEQSEVCLEYYNDRSSNIYSCIMRISRFNSKMEGQWQLELSYRVGRRDEFRSDSIQLYEGKLPGSIILTHENSNIEYPDNKNDRTTINEVKMEKGQDVKVECRVLGGNPEPSPVLQINRNKFVDLKAVNPCRNPPRGESCLEFEFNALEDYDRQELQCGFTMPLFELSPREQESMRATAAISFGRDGRVTNNGDEIRLVDTSRNQLEVCDSNLKIGDRFTIEVEFETGSRPYEIEWEIGYLTRFPVIVRYNSAASGYRNLRYRNEGRDIYTALIEIDRVSSSDIDDNHLVTIENEARVRQEFVVDLSNSRNCDGGSDSCRFGDRDCLCNQNRDKCCNNSRGCRDNCCFICNPSRDRDCECDGDLCCDNDPNCRGEFCCEEKTSTAQGCDPFKDGRDCICDGRRESCCLLTQGCSGSNCCEECDDQRDTECGICYRRQCYKIKESIKGKENKTKIQGEVSDLFINSCLDLSKIILTQFKADGSDRNNNNGGGRIDSVFRREIEDFFRTVRCTGFDRELLTKLDTSEDLSSVFFTERLGGTGGPFGHSEATFKSGLRNRTRSPSSMTQKAQSIIDIKTGTQKGVGGDEQRASSTPAPTSNAPKPPVNSKIFGRRPSATGSDEA